MSENILKPGPLKPTGAPSSGEISEIQLLSHQSLTGYWPSERRAVLVHRFYLCMERKREISLEETIRSWEGGVGRSWRRRKMARDCEQQLREIERHKYLVSQRLGYDIGWEAAAKDWIEHHAQAWRDWWEGQPEAGA